MTTIPIVTIRPAGQTQLHLIRHSRWPRDRIGLSIEGKYGETTTTLLDHREVRQLITALTSALRA